jgi:hypothetical protein
MPVFFVTFSTHKRRSLLANEEVHNSFSGYANEAYP